MNFDFSDDQKTIQDQARLVLSRECPPDRARQALEHARAYDETLWKQVAELGWPAIAIDEEFGGLGMGYLELCVIAMRNNMHGIEILVAHHRFADLVDAVTMSVQYDDMDITTLLLSLDQVVNLLL